MNVYFTDSLVHIKFTPSVFTHTHTHTHTHIHTHTHTHTHTRRKNWLNADTAVTLMHIEFGKSQRAVKNRGKWRKLVAKSSVVSPTTLAVKGLMMMMNSSPINHNGLH